MPPRTSQGAGGPPCCGGLVSTNLCDVLLFPRFRTPTSKRKTKQLILLRCFFHNCWPLGSRFVFFDFKLGLCAELCPQEKLFTTRTLGCQQKSAKGFVSYAYILARCIDYCWSCFSVVVCWSLRLCEPMLFLHSVRTLVCVSYDFLTSSIRTCLFYFRWRRRITSCIIRCESFYFCTISKLLTRSLTRASRRGKI